jgi:protein tyrosine kinase modulator
MKEQIVLMAEENRTRSSYTARDLAAAIFRHRRIAASSIIAMVAGAILAAYYLPSYTGEFQVLVRRSRIDPVVTAEQDSRPEMKPGVTEEELNSEAQVMRSADVLRPVVLATGLDKHEHGFLANLTPEQKIQKAMDHLSKRLDISVVKKTDIVDVVYKNKDPKLAAEVAKALASSYMEKHALVQRPGGQSDFFEKQMIGARTRLKDAEGTLAAFNKNNATVTPAAERDLAVQKMNEFVFNAEQARASVRQTQDRIRTLEGLEKSVPERITTTVKLADNSMLLEQMKSKLLALELQRNDLLAKYQPTYRPVQDVEKQIADTKAAIANENANPVKEESTDLNTTNAWVRSELAKARADLATYGAAVTAAQAGVTRYQARTQQLQGKALEEQEIQRNLKVTEANYLLYQQKLEEARISDGLDKQGILNVALTETPSVPVLPSRPGWVYATLVALLACMLGAFAIVTAEFADNTFRTPDELRGYLPVPVLAAIPHSAASSPVAYRRAKLLSGSVAS